MEKEYENWNVECKKPILVRGTESAAYWIVNLDFDITALQVNSVGKWNPKIWYLSFIQ